MAIILPLNTETGSALLRNMVLPNMKTDSRNVGEKSNRFPQAHSTIVLPSSSCPLGRLSGAGVGIGMLSGAGDSLI